MVGRGTVRIHTDPDRPIRYLGCTKCQTHLPDLRTTRPVLPPEQSTPSGSNGTPPSYAPFRARFRAQVDLVDTQDTEGERIGRVRTDLWQSCLCDPVAAFTERWVSAWDLFANEVRANKSTAATAFTDIDALISELQGIWQGAWKALRTWHRECATPYNERHCGTGDPEEMLDFWTGRVELRRCNSRLFGNTWGTFVGFEPTWLLNWNNNLPEPNPEQWRLRWGDAPPGPQGIPRRIAEWTASQHREDQYAWSELKAPLDIISIFGLLGTNHPHREIERELSTLIAREGLANVSMLLAAMILPTPTLLPRFFEGNPTPETISLANRVLWWSTAVITDSLYDGYRLMRDERSARIDARITTRLESESLDFTRTVNAPSSIIDSNIESLPTQEMPSIPSPAQAATNDERPPPDGPLDPFSFKWKGEVKEFLENERRYYHFLLAIWPEFRTMGTVHFDVVNDRLCGAGRVRLGVSTMKNYAKELSQILSRWKDFPAEVKKDEYFIRWKSLRK